MSDQQVSTTAGIKFWLFLPLRLFTHGSRFVFGHPAIWAVIFTVLSVVFFYVGSWPSLPGPDGRVVAGGGSPIYAAMPLASLWAMMVGLLLIWMSEHAGLANTVWREAPSLWVPTLRPAEVEDLPGN